MKKMTIVFGRDGLSYECFYCKQALAQTEADNHNCEEN